MKIKKIVRKLIFLFMLSKLECSIKKIFQGCTISCCCTSSIGALIVCSFDSLIPENYFKVYLQLCKVRNFSSQRRHCCVLILRVTSLEFVQLDVSSGASMKIEGISVKTEES